nr:hypothetical protein Iba_chr03eCG8340 [Ipomoea batatas]
MPTWMLSSAASCLTTSVFWWMRMTVLLVMIPSIIVILWRRLNLRICFTELSVFSYLIQTMSCFFSNDLRQRSPSLWCGLTPAAAILCTGSLS